MERRAAFAAPMTVPSARNGGVSRSLSLKPCTSVTAQLKMPKMPSLPAIPGFGQGKTEAEAIEEVRNAPVSKVAVTRAPTGAAPTVRAATGAVAIPVDAKNAKTIGEISGVPESSSIAAGAGWKRFPKRRMPGANLDQWKAIAKEIGPDV